MKKIPFIKNARITSITVAAPVLALLMTLTFAACDRGTPVPIDTTPTTPGTTPEPTPGTVPGTTPETKQPTISPAPVVTPVISDLLIIDELEPIEGNALVFLGMLRLDAWAALMAHMSQDDVQGGNDFYSSIDDGYHKTNELNDFGFFTNEDEELYHITFITPRYPAKTGLRVGDTTASAVELYSTEFLEYTGDGGLGDYMYEYAIGGHYFAVYFKDGAISGWRVSRYSEQTYRDNFTDSVRLETDDFT